MIEEQIAVTLFVVDALDALGILYAIGGSLASAVHGAMRATMDADLVADLHSEHVEPLAQALQDAFYADADMMRDAMLVSGALTRARVAHRLEVYDCRSGEPAGYLHFGWPRPENRDLTIAGP